MDKQKLLIATCEKFHEVASKEIGTTEEAGPGNNQRVLEYHALTKGGATLDSVPWCSAFVSWVIEQCGLPSTKSAWARSYLSWGIPTDKPTKGCVVVFKRNENSGHVGFYDGEDEKSIFVLGGNQDNTVKIKAYSKEDFLGYRVPVLRVRLFADLVKSTSALGQWHLVYRENFQECKNHVPSRDIEL